MTRRLVRHCVRGGIALAVCFVFGWSLSETAAALTRHIDHTH